MAFRESIESNIEKWAVNRVDYQMSELIELECLPFSKFATK